MYHMIRIQMIYTSSKFQNTNTVTTILMHFEDKRDVQTGLRVICAGNGYMGDAGPPPPFLPFPPIPPPHTASGRHVEWMQLVTGCRLRSRGPCIMILYTYPDTPLLSHERAFHCSSARLLSSRKMYMYDKSLTKTTLHSFLLCKKNMYIIEEGLPPAPTTMWQGTKTIHKACFPI